MADGSIEFKTTLDNADLEKKLKEAERKVDSLKRKLESETSNRSVIEQQMDRAQKSIEAASAETERLRERLESLQNVDPTNADEWFRAQREVQGLTQRLESAEKHELELAGNKEKLDQKWQSANDKVKVYTEQLERAQTRQTRLGEEYARTYSRAGASVSAGMERAKAAMDSFSSRINTMLKRVFVFGVILKAVRAVSNALGNAFRENMQFSASWAALQATVQGVANAIASWLAPAIIGLINGATAAITVLAKTIDSIFGTSIMQAIQQARAAAEAQWRQTDESKAAQKAAEQAAKAAQNQAKANKDLAKSADKARRSIMSFDEINALNAEDADDAADALGDEGDAMGGGLEDPGALMKPNWDAFDVGKIDAKLAEIMLILGAALMAVGAILCFSGINIPLGITLMAIGALMIYTAYKEQWDKLPQEVRNAITNALVITGAVLLVIGAILAFSGANIPLGVGMMVAGALLIWTAIALNWESIPQELQNVITIVGAILGVALLVIGAVLAFSGANVPLGIALMAIGAISLAAVVALNWETIKDNLDTILPIIEAALGATTLVLGAVLAFSGVNVPLGIALMAAGAVTLAKLIALDWDKVPDKIKGIITTLSAALGAALLVVGAVLAFSGANLPLGIALMVGGALALGSALTLNWDKMPQSVKNTVVTIESIVGPALLVIGAVLCFSGAGIPLGISCIAAGALALAHAASINWNEMPTKVRDVVTEILGIVGGALIVIGVILIVTGVGIPLGIACIVAGVGSLVAAAAINWDFIVDKVKEIWGKIKDFWKQNIAPIFTWEWWANLFKSIVNGLIEQINNGLSAFGSFAQNIANGIADTLNFFNIDWTPFDVTMPQIPYLAQGAVIPPNREFMAVLGDQRRGTNIETPESLMRQVVREETGPLLADMVSAIVNANFGTRQGDVVLMVGRKELARETMRGIGELQDTGELGSGIVFA